MNRARCICGDVTLSLPASPKLVVACHCSVCKHRTGAPFGVGVFYPEEEVVISGSPKPFARVAASGGRVVNSFCPNCGSTVYWRAEILPAFIGVAIGTIEDLQGLAPNRSIFERSKLGWAEICCEGVERFESGSAKIAG